MNRVLRPRKICRRRVEEQRRWVTISKGGVARSMTVVVTRSQGDLILELDVRAI